MHPTTHWPGDRPFDIDRAWRRTHDRPELGPLTYADACVEPIARRACLVVEAQGHEEGIAFFEEFMGEEAKRAGEKIGVEHAEEFRLLDLS
jgi:hypothetical protein